MAINNETETRSTMVTPPRYPTYSQGTTPTTSTDQKTVELVTGGASFEAIGGAAAIVLAIIGLAGYLPFYMTAISAIAVGAGMLVHGVTVAARWRDTIERFRRERNEELAFAGGIGTETVGGACGVVLGILALANVMPGVLLPVAAIVLGASALLAGPAQPQLAQLARDRDPRFEDAFHDAVRATTGVDVLVGAGAIVLGILALLGIGPAMTLTMVSMLALGVGLLLAGGALAARFGRQLRHAS